MKSGVRAKTVNTHMFLYHGLRENQEIIADWQCFTRKQDLNDKIM